MGDLAGKLGRRRSIDASGCYVLPGLVDFHVHLADRIGRFELADDWASGSRVAAANGITTICGFVTQEPTAPLGEGIRRARAKGEGASRVDFLWHLTPTRFEPADWNDFERLAAAGYRTFKLYTTYREAGIYAPPERIGGALPPARPVRRHLPRPLRGRREDCRRRPRRSRPLPRRDPRPAPAGNGRGRGDRGDRRDGPRGRSFAPRGPRFDLGRGAAPRPGPPGGGGHRRNRAAVPLALERPARAGGRSPLDLHSAAAATAGGVPRPRPRRGLRPLRDRSLPLPARGQGRPRPAGRPDGGGRSRRPGGPPAPRLEALRGGSRPGRDGSSPSGSPATRPSAPASATGRERSRPGSTPTSSFSTRTGRSSRSARASPGSTKPTRASPPRSPSATCCSAGSRSCGTADCSIPFPLGAARSSRPPDCPTRRRRPR